METSAAEPPGRRGFCSPVRAGGAAKTLLTLKTMGSLRENKMKGLRGNLRELEKVRSPQRRQRESRGSALRTQTRKLSEEQQQREKSE